MIKEELLKRSIKEFDQIFQEDKGQKGILQFNQIVDRLIESLTTNEAFWEAYFELLIADSTTEEVNVHSRALKQFIHSKAVVILRDAFPGNEDVFVMKFENKLYSIFASFLNRPDAYGRIYELSLKSLSNAT